MSEGWQLFWWCIATLIFSFLGCYAAERTLNWWEDRKLKALPVDWYDPPHWITWKSSGKGVELASCQSCQTGFAIDDEVFVFPQPEEDLLYCAECVVN